MDAFDSSKTALEEVSRTGKGKSGKAAKSDGKKLAIKIAAELGMCLTIVTLTWVAMYLVLRSQDYFQSSWASRLLWSFGYGFIVILVTTAIGTVISNFKLYSEVPYGNDPCENASKQCSSGCLQCMEWKNPKELKKLRAQWWPYEHPCVAQRSILAIWVFSGVILLVGCFFMFAESQVLSAFVVGIVTLDISSSVLYLGYVRIGHKIMLKQMFVATETGRKS